MKRVSNIRARSARVSYSKDLISPHPETLRWQCIRDLKEAYPDGRVSPHDFPFFIKKDKSHEAEGVFLVKDRASLIEVLDFLALQERADVKGFITQDFISCGGNVLRAVIMGKQIITYWKRPNKPGQEITTISQGAIIDHDWRPDLQKKGRSSAKALAKKTGINLAAIDFVSPIADKDPEPLILEINYYFGRRGLDGTENYYRLLYEAIQAWLRKVGLDPESVKLI